jgi:hypothetical protein
MSDSLSKQEQFLLKEYETAVQLTYHIDELRNKVTNFFMSFSGVAAAGVTILIKGDVKNNILTDAEGLIGLLLMLVALVGVIVVATLGRLRKVQIEHFRIINNVRTYFLGEDYDLWNITQLSSKTLPYPSRRSGTYMWLLLVMLLSSYVFAFSVYLIGFELHSIIPPTLLHWVIPASYVFFIVIQDRVYFAAASPPPQQTYSDEYRPF